MFLRLFLALAPILVVPTIATAVTEDDCNLYIDSNEHKLSETLHVAEIRINAGDLFDLGKADHQRLVHRLSNSLHFKTRDQTIAAALPFRAGDVFTQALLAESERVLRSKRYIRDATVKAHTICDKGVVIDVHTIDNWTLTPSLSFGRAGGESTYTIEIQDLNFLGMGKEFKLHDQRSGDLRESTFIYGDDNILGGRHQIHLEIGDNDDGELFDIQTGLPFYSHSSTHAWWLNISSQTLAYTSTNQSNQLIPVHTELADLRYNHRLQHSTNSSFIVGGGVRYARQKTHLKDNVTNSFALTDYQNTYPYLSAAWGRKRWLKKQNVDNIRVNEDINLGISIAAEAGFIAKGIDNNQRNQLRLQLGFGKGWQMSTRAFHKFEFKHTQFFNSVEKKQSTSGRYRYFRWLTQKDQLNIRLTAEQVQGYSPISHKMVGGENGLKAYPHEFQRGENRAIGMIEYKHVTNWSPYSLAHTAFSIFAETGRAWTDSDDAKSLANVGVGFLLSPSRSSTAAINRFEIAVPLVHGEDVGKYQFFIGTTVNY